MSSLIDVAEFHSEKFAPVLPEESQVNPAVYGAELAFWIAQELARRGLAPSYPESEDWGWCVEWSTPEGAEFALHCCNTEGRKDHWCIALRRFGRKWFGRDKPPYTDAVELLDALKASLDAEPSITELKWCGLDGALD
ncbi:MAG: hypothetical protein H6970_00860 [Gammaproteobacteria bacterium]|nr:hypothetical protein [Gammaproteobacteria bacterium]MCP5423607.1 hypothetical protein [Gammaproteobacteria bacterium]